MNKLIFYILVIIFLYFIFSRLIDNYSDIENFDPSLVPIPSIVTLGKISQKIVNNTGTLINPGNLTINNKLSVTGSTNITNTSGNLIFDIGNIASDDKKINTKIQSGNGTGTRLRFQKDDTLPQMDIYDNGNVDVFGSKIINGNLTVNKDIIDNNANIKFGNKAMIYSEVDPISNDLWVRLMKTDGTANYSDGFAANNLYSENNTIVNRKLNVNGTANLNTLNVSEDATITGTTDGFLKLKTNIWLKSTDNAERLHFGNNSHSYYGSKNGYHKFSMANNKSLELVNELSIDGNINVTGTITAKDVLVNGKSVVDNFLKINLVNASYGAEVMGPFLPFVPVSDIITPLITAANNNQTYTVSNFYVANETMKGDFSHRLPNKKLQLIYTCGTNPNARTIYVGEGNNLNFSCP